MTPAVKPAVSSINRDDIPTIELDPVAQSCGTCMFYIGHECRRKLPETSDGIFPRMVDKEWCFKWRLAADVETDPRAFRDPRKAAHMIERGLKITVAKFNVRDAKTHGTPA